jgi:hypothetical protein
MTTEWGALVGYFSLAIRPPVLSQHRLCFLNTACAFSTPPMLSQYRLCFLNTAYAFSTPPVLSQARLCFLNTAYAFSTPPVLSQHRLCFLNSYLNSWRYSQAGVFPPDAVTLKWLETIGRGDLTEETSKECRPDADATYAKELTLDLHSVQPHVAGPNKVALVYLQTYVCTCRACSHLLCSLSNARCR